MFLVSFFFLGGGDAYALFFSGLCVRVCFLFCESDALCCLVFSFALSGRHTLALAFFFIFFLMSRSVFVLVPINEGVHFFPFFSCMVFFFVCGWVLYVRPCPYNV